MKKAIFPILFILLLAACPGKKEIMEIQDGIEEIQLKLNELQRQSASNSETLSKLSRTLENQIDEIRSAQAEINQQLSTLSRETRILTQNLQQTEQKLSTLAGRLEARAGIGATAGTPSRIISSPPARSVYNNAYTDFSLGNWELAIQGFKEYIEKYPRDDLTDNAQYWIGECYYSKGDYDQAVRAFDAVIHTYADSEKIPEAHLKKGMIFIAQDRLAQAVLELQYVIDNYPDSPEAEKARERIREIGLAGR